MNISFICGYFFASVYEMRAAGKLSPTIIYVNRFNSNQKLIFKHIFGVSFLQVLVSYWPTYMHIPIYICDKLKSSKPSFVSEYIHFYVVTIYECVCAQICAPVCVYESCFSVSVCVCWYACIKNCVCVHLLCTLCQAPCNIFRYFKVFGLFKVVEGFWSPRELG